MLLAAGLALHHVLSSPSGCLRAADAAMMTLVIGAVLVVAPRRVAAVCVALPVTLIVVGVLLERVVLPRITRARVAAAAER